MKAIKKTYNAPATSIVVMEHSGHIMAGTTMEVKNNASENSGEKYDYDLGW